MLELDTKYNKLLWRSNFCKEGKVSGNTNSFRLSGHWGSGKAGRVVMTRITQQELECMKKKGKYNNGICHR